MNEPAAVNARDRQVPRSESDLGEDALEREFWSTFGEGGVCVFWGVESADFEELPESLRRLLVGYTVAVAQAPDAERARRLAELRRLPREERLNRLCTLATAAQGAAPNARAAD